MAGIARRMIQVKFRIQFLQVIGLYLPVLAQLVMIPDRRAKIPDQFLIPDEFHADVHIGL